MCSFELLCLCYSEYRSNRKYVIFLSVFSMELHMSWWHWQNKTFQTTHWQSQWQYRIFFYYSYTYWKQVTCWLQHLKGGKVKFKYNQQQSILNPITSLLGEGRVLVQRETNGGCFLPLPDQLQPDFSSSLSFSLFFTQEAAVIKTGVAGRINEWLNKTPESGKTSGGRPAVGRTHW